MNFLEKTNLVNTETHVTDKIDPGNLANIKPIDIYLFPLTGYFGRATRNRQRLQKLAFTFFMALLLPVFCNAEWVPLNGKGTQQAPPNVTLLSDNLNSTVIKVDLPGFELHDFITADKTYQGVDLTNDIFTTKAGSPKIPYIAKILALPDHAAVSVEILETEGLRTFNDVLLPPARESWLEGNPEPSYVESKMAYQSKDVFPAKQAQIDPPSVFRDFRMTRVAIYPIRYIAGSKELEVLSSITVKINYDSGKAINPKTAPKRDIVPSFGQLYRNSIFNYESVLNREYGGKETGQELMLCIMPDNFATTFQPYADWKRESGTNIHITLFSDIGANPNNPLIIREHIADAYYNWEVAPTYVIIIGDAGIFPKKIVNYDYSFPNEDYFVELEGDDHFPEMMIGRFTNQGEYRLNVMVNKFMSYEKTPDTTETDWFIKGVCCSNNDYESQVETKRFVADVMHEDGLFLSVDTLMSDGNYGGYECSVDLDDVMNTINEGRSVLNYRGEGWTSGWDASCYQFSTSDVYSLNNGEKFTFVTSIGCGVAMFDTWGADNCFGEAWIEMGSLDNLRGCVSFVGPTSNSHTTYNNRIDKGIYVGMFREGMTTPGQGLLRGKLYMYNVFGNDPLVEYHYRVFCVLGDPSLRIWKKIPLEIIVDHPTSINVGTDKVEVNMVYSTIGQAVNNAKVCLSGEYIYATGTTDETGHITFDDVLPAIPDILALTVTGNNVYPYQGEIEVIQPDVHVVPDDNPEVTDIDGNNDGLINPNENCSITFTLKNWGTSTASNIEANLTANPDFVEILTTTPVDFGNLNPGASSTGDPFQFYLKPECEIGQTITLQLNISSDSDSWAYEIKEIVHGCQLLYDNFVVIDDQAEVTNYRMDPGETVNLYVSIRNYGDDLAPNVLGVLSTNDPHITVIDSISTFGSLEINGSNINEYDNFLIEADAACPTGYMADYELELIIQGGNYDYSTTTPMQIPVALPIPDDYSGPDEYGYYAYASTDAIYEQTPEFDWFGIESLGTKIEVPDMSNYTTTVNLPFGFKYYGNNFTSVRISTDGWIAPGSGNQSTETNAPLPHYDNVNNMVAAFWDDLYESNYYNPGNIYYYADYPNHRFIIQWDSITHNDFESEIFKETFQVIIRDPAYYDTPTGDGELIFQYKIVDEIENNTIGIESYYQDIGLNYVFNDEYEPTATQLTNGIAIKFTTQPPFVPIYVSVDEENETISDHIVLHPNKPNPFHQYTQLSYTLKKQNNIALQIYDLKGTKICDLFEGNQPAGKHTHRWDGTDNSGNPVESGIYLYRLKTNDFSGSMKMFLLR